MHQRFVYTWLNMNPFPWVCVRLVVVFGHVYEPTPLPLSMFVLCDMLTAFFVKNMSSKDFFILYYCHGWQGETQC